MEYIEYAAEDFALDKSFQQWVLQENLATDTFWGSWKEKHPEKKSCIEEAVELVRLVNLSTDSLANQSYLSVWGHLREEIGQESMQKKSDVAWYTGVAAAVAVLLGVGLYLLFRQDRLLTFACGYGETEEVVLPDGSRVTLNANSNIQCGRHWDKGAVREVFLEGEAYFDVVKTAGHDKFVVRTRDSLAVQVLGTSFNVNTRRDSMSVYLHTGHVKLVSAKDTVSLTPGEVAAYDTKAGTIAVKKESPHRSAFLLAWKRNVFMYDDVALPAIAMDIEDYYGWKVTLTDSSLYTKRFTGEISRNDAMGFFNVLSETLNIAIEQKDDEVVMRVAGEPTIDSSGALGV